MNTLPPDLWWRDHWSTLAYVETRLVDKGAYSVMFDPRMRQSRRNYRVLPGNKSHGVPMDEKNGTRLSNNTYLPWHDDWCCVQGMVDAGLLAGVDED